MTFTSFKPLLAAKAELAKLRYPLLVSPKIDGIRATVFDGKVYSRTKKLIPNKFVQQALGHPKLNRLDGELVVGNPYDPGLFHKTSSGVMSQDGEPRFTFHVFDDWAFENMRFTERLALANKMVQEAQSIWPWTQIVLHTLVSSEDELLNHEALAVHQGYEGLMLRDPAGRYKFGRSTVKEGILLKLKRFEDSEAEIIGIEQLLRNDNEPTENELGYVKRSSAKAGLIPTDQLGRMIVRDKTSGVEFSIGSGFTEAQRKAYWNDRFALQGTTIKYKFQAYGVDKKPRFPIFLGFRPEGA